MKITLPRDPYESKKYLRRKSTFELYPGITALVGCNGAGKTTLLKNLKEYAEEHNIPVFNFDNLTYDTYNRRSMLNSLQDFQYTATLAWSSEGEKTIIRMGDMAEHLGRFCMKLHKDAKEIFILMDAIGSGTSLDNIVALKEQLFKTILDNKFPNQEIYIIVATNEFEMCVDSDCFDVYTCTHRSFKTYNQYKKFILKSREKRDALNF